MLTRFIRIQLVIFTVASVIGLILMAVDYLKVPMFLGVGRYDVTLELPAGGGIYRFANVTYRGVQVGKVTSVDLTPDGAVATLSVTSTPRIPADLDAEVRSLSAVGEQYVDLRPRTDGGPYLHQGSVIPASRAAVPQPIGPMLDRLSNLVSSIPEQRIPGLLQETSTALDGAEYDLGSLLDSAARLSADTRAASNQARGLIDDSAPLLEGAVQSAADTRRWAADLAAVSAQLRTNDPQLRQIVQNGPGAFDEVSRLLDDVKPTLPILLANLTSLGQVALTYHPSLEQVMVLLPSFLGGFDQISQGKNATGVPIGNFHLQIGDPPACTVGFLPPSQWRSPSDTTTLDTPDGLYCKLPQDSPIAVRGARNFPCMGQPGKRAPTVEICDSDKPYEPLALRQHVLGPYPIDPNLIAQGVPPDDRVEGGAAITAPLEGTPPPAGAPPPEGAPEEPAPAQQPPASDGAESTPPVPDTAPNSVAPSSFRPGGSPGISVASYDPTTGRYVTADGTTQQQTNLAQSGVTPGWRQMVLPIGEDK